MVTREVNRIRKNNDNHRNSDWDIGLSEMLRSVVLPSHTSEENELISMVLNDIDAGINGDRNKSLEMIINEGIEPCHFLDIRNRRIWQICLELNEADAGMVTTENVIKSLSEEERNLGYVGYIIQDLVPASPINFRLKTSCKKVIDYKRLMDTIVDFRELMTEVSDNPRTDVGAHLDYFVGRASDSGMRAMSQECYTPAQVFDFVERDFEDRMAGRFPQSHKFGIEELDQFFPHGVREGTIITIGAAPGVGKTGVLMDLMRRQCIGRVQEGKDPEYGIFFTTEMSPEQYAERIWMPQINSFEKNYPELNSQLLGQKKQAFSEAMRRDEMRIIFVNAIDMTMDQIVNRVRSLSREYNVRWVALDYIQNVRVGISNANTNRTELMTELMRRFRALAVETKAVFLLAAQLNKVYRQGKTYPDASAFKDSSKIEEDSSVIIMMDHLRDKDGKPFDTSVLRKERKSIPIWCKVCKNRLYGLVGEAHLGIRCGSVITEISAKRYQRIIDENDIYAGDVNER